MCRLWRVWRTGAVAIVLLVSWCSFAADNAAVFAWAKRHAEKDKAELGLAEALPLGSIVTLRIPLDPSRGPSWLGPYEQGFAQIHLQSLLFHVALQESCRDAGEFEGKDGSGMKFTLRKWTCERLLLWPQNQRPADVRRIPMAPAQYRDTQTLPSAAELEVELVAAGDGKLATYVEGVRSATVSHPVEIRGKTWSVYGIVRRIHLLLPGGMSVTVVP
jgi:hypothetical protein